MVAGRTLIAGGICDDMPLLHRTELVRRKVTLVPNVACTQKMLETIGLNEIYRDGLRVRKIVENDR